MSTRELLFPRKIPRYIREDPMRSAECSVFEKLDRTLDSRFAIFYSRPWFGLGPTGEEIDGEADFVIAHEDYGILVLEVKGGAVSYDPAQEIWKSRDRHGFTHTIKNPVAQARKSKYRFRELLNNPRLWKPRRVTMRHGVVFPHSVKWHMDLGADMPLSIFAFEDDCRHLGGWIEKRMTREEGPDGTGKPLHKDGLAALTQLLAQPFQLQSRLGVAVEEEDREIISLTDQQFHLLDGFRDARRLLITGGAGTGKTLMALEKACRLSAEKIRTLLVCYNEPLASHLRRAASGFPGLHVATFHELCLNAANATGIAMNIGQESDETLGQKLRLATEKGFGEFGAIIVDEAQDFHAVWWEPLQQCLSDSESGLLYAFQDSRQRVQPWKNTRGAAVESASYALTRNLRNTKEIFEIAYPWFDDSYTMSAGPDGHPVVWCDLEAQADAANQICMYVQRMVTTEGIGAGAIAVLVPTERESRLLARDGMLNRLPVQRAGESRKDAVTVDSIRRFKGLENSAVVVWFTGATIPETELLYVALTRARSHLAIFADARINLALRAALEKRLKPSSFR